MSDQLLPRNNDENQIKEAFHAAMSCLESIRATNPEYITDHLPPGWGMNQLRAFDGIERPEGAQPSISLSRDVLAALIDMANDHVNDIESGIEDGTYLASDNQDINEKQQAVATAEAIYRVAVMARHPDAPAAMDGPRL